MLFSKVGTGEASKLVVDSVSEFIWVGPHIMAILTMETSQTIRNAIIASYSEGLSRVQIPTFGISKPVCKNNWVYQK